MPRRSRILRWIALILGSLAGQFGVVATMPQRASQLADSLSSTERQRVEADRLSQTVTADSLLRRGRALSTQLDAADPYSDLRLGAVLALSSARGLFFLALLVDLVLAGVATLKARIAIRRPRERTNAG